MSGSAFEGAAAASYRDGARRNVPGYESMHRMVSQLLDERIPATGRVLVLGAGGGQELKTLGDAHPRWRLDGVDPSADMLTVAAQVAADHAARLTLHQGTVEVAPEGPFDGATAILTFHFIARAARLETLQQLRRRLAPGAPLVLVHFSFPQEEPERSRWIERHVAYGLSNGMDPTRAQATREGIGTMLTILSPEEEVAMLEEAGFVGPSLFYAGLSLRGWVAYAG